MASSAAYSTLRPSLGYPDPTGEFFGYNRATIVDWYAPNTTQSTKELVAIVGSAATSLVALRGGAYVATKGKCAPLYADHVGDEWTELVSEVHALCRDRLAYGIPETADARRRLKGICARVLAFEQHALLAFEGGGGLGTGVAGDPVPTVVKTYAARLRRTLNDRLVGVYLGGSLVMGDFVEGSSDYDVLAIVADDLSSKDLAALAALHESLASEFPEAMRLEGDYVPRADLRPDGTSKPAWFFRRGQLQSEPALMLSADNVANLRHAGVAVFGPPAATVLPEVRPAQVRSAVRAMLEEIADPPDEQTAAHEILDLGRSYRALETGMPTTKTEGLRWGLSILDPSFHALLRHAEAIRQGAPVPPGDRFLRRGIVDLRKAFRDRYSKLVEGGEHGNETPEIIVESSEQVRESDDPQRPDERLP